MTRQTTRRNAYLGIWTLLIAVTVLGVSTSAQFRQAAGGVTVYVDSNFSGQSESVRNDMPTLVPSGLNDKISSIRIPNGETWEVCVNINYGGPCQVLSGSLSDLRSVGWNDRISSLRRVDNDRFGNRESNGRFGNRQPDRGMTVYVDANFRGPSAAVRNDLPTLVPSGLNDQISSIQIPDGERWEVCVDINYRNQCRVLSESVSDLRSLGWNDRISSLRRVDNDRFGNRESNGRFGNRRPDGIIVYTDSNFRGRSEAVRSDMPNLVTSGLNDQISSIQIPDGETWEVCVDINYRNQCRVLSESVSDLRSLGWNDRISSLRRVDGFGSRQSNGRFGDR